jgi:hypothetical protein
MRLGKIKYFIFIFITVFYANYLKTEEKIFSVPLVNLEKLKPSYEEIVRDETKLDNDKTYNLKKKIITKNKSKNITINLLGLDKITAKTSKINIKIGKTKKFGLLEIKAIKCGTTDSIDEKSKAAYIQIKDLSDNQNEKVFVFNGWTFSSSTSLRPIDHAVYDIWLVDCENI